MKPYGRRGLERYLLKAAPYIENRGRALGLITRAVILSRRRKFPVLRSLKNLTTLIQIFRDWVNGEYKDIPKASILAIAAAILYFVSPVDIILDLIPLGGIIDDMAVIAFVMNKINEDVIRYRIWKESGDK